jgi:putative SOS response-associated peptidase YedK
MCTKVAYKVKKMIDSGDTTALSLFADELKQQELQDGVVNGYTYPHLPVITKNGLESMQWGLVPSWVKDVAQALEMRQLTLNAKCETVHQKPSFRGAYNKGQRCLVPVTGFIEYHHFEKSTYPFVIEGDGATTYLAGLYDLWTNPADGEVWKTFTIITAPADALMAKIHNSKKRMPLIIKEDQVDSWLIDDAATAGFLQTPHVHLKAYTIDKAKMNDQNEESLKKHTYRELPPISPYTPEAQVLAEIFADLHKKAGANLDDPWPTDEQIVAAIKQAKQEDRLPADYAEERPKFCPNCQAWFTVPDEPCDNCGWPTLEAGQSSDQLGLF